MGCLKSILNNPIVKPIADVAAIATGNPELIPLINGGLTAVGGLANGQSLGNALGKGAISGGLSFAGNEALGALGNAFPETASSLGFTDTGGNSLTDLLGTTSGAGSLSGAGTIGGDISNLVNGDSNTMSSLLGSGSSPGISGSNPTGNPISNGFSSPGLSMAGAGPSSTATTSLANSGLNISAGGGASTYGGGGATPSFSGSSYGASDPYGLNAAYGSPATSVTAPSFSSSATPPIASAAPSSGGIMSKLLGGTSPLSLGAAVLGGINTMSANSSAQKDLTNAGNAALADVAPYQASGIAANSKLSDLLGTSANAGSSGYGSLTTPYTPGDLTTDPGYQFNLQQGQQALDRKNAASGNYFSGGALKDATTYAQGLADNTYNNAFQRNLAQNQATYGDLAGQAGAGQNAANSAGNINTQIGSAKAAGTISSSNILNNTLSSLLSGSGAKRPVNIGGQIVYI